MPNGNPTLTVIHYYFLLKSDEEDLLQLWSALTGGASVEGSLAPSPDTNATSSFLASEEIFPALDLTAAPDEVSGQCQLVQRVDIGETGFCLSMLPEMAVVEVAYRKQHEDMYAAWHEALETLERNRTQLFTEVSAVFGETTALIAPDGADVSDIAAAVGGQSDRILSTPLNPGVAGGEPAMLVHFPDMTKNNRDYYAVSGMDAESFAATGLPRLDSLIKKLSRTAHYFEEQRLTIASERGDVDREVGALLHRKIISDASGSAGTATLEEQIANLSRMFGLLATDSLLVRRSSDSMSRDLKSLDREFERIGSPGQRDEIGAYYSRRFSLDLAEAHSESRDLDFSRQSAQAAIEVVRTQVEIMRAGEEAAIQRQSQEILSSSLVLQQERLALQVAAGFVEFVLVFYYVLKSWEGIVGTDLVEHMAPLLRLVVVGSFSGAAAVGTHFLALTLQNQTWKSKGLWLSVATLVLSLAAMVMLSIAYQ